MRTASKEAQLRQVLQKVPSQRTTRASNQLELNVMLLRKLAMEGPG